MVHRIGFPWYPEHIPEELKVGRCWVCCDAQKVPLIAGKRKRASCSDPATWRSYDAAVRVLERHPERYAGVGRIISAEDPYVGVDLDRVRDPVTRELSPTALGVLSRLDSYAEVSPSGRGVKVWVRAALERSHVKPGLEVYQRSRYFVLTGQFLPQYPLEIQRRAAEIEDLVRREFPSVSRQERTPYDGPQLALLEYLEGLEVLAEVPDASGVKFAVVCPWVSQHTNGDRSGTYIGQYEDAGMWFACWHAHCAHRSWTDFRRYVRFRAKKLRLIEREAYA